MTTTPSRFRLPRRTVLRGALRGALATVALPPLAAMLGPHGDALAGGRPLPRRFGVFFWGNGVRLDRWVPKEQGTGWALTEELAPLAPVKDYVSVVSGMEIMTGNERGHHAGTVGILSGSPMVPQPHPTSGYASTFSAPSIDQVAASAIGTGTPFRSLEVGISRRPSEGEGTTLLYLSHRGPDNPNPPEYDPVRVFERLFGPAGRPGAGGASALAAERALGRSVLDVVGEDARTLKAHVGKHDAARLEQHLENIREIEKRLDRDWARGKTCRSPARPNDYAEDDGKEPLLEVNEAMSRLVALALSCDLTRVFSFMFSGSVSGTVFWQIGATQSHHQLTHDEPKDQPLVHAGTVFTMERFARLLQALKETPDGAGNLLDRCAILASTDTAQGREHTLKDYPILIAGRAGGGLKHPGVHYRSKGENTSRVLLSVLRSVGVRLPAYGNKGGLVKESCSAIEA